jgi:hypothetical protein
MTAIQRGEDWLRTAPLEEIRAAAEAGELAILLSQDPAAHGQLTEADLKNLTPEQVVQAEADGKLNHILGRPMPLPAEGQLTNRHLAQMTAEQIVAAQDAGRFDAVLGRTPAGTDV